MLPQSSGGPLKWPERGCYDPGDIAVPVPAGSQPDYAEVYPPPAIIPVPAPSSGSSPSLRSVKQLSLRTNTQCFPMCAITDAEITPFKGGDPALSTRRPPNPFFLEKAVSREFIAEVTTSRGRTMAVYSPSSMQSS
jgi:hypothetical protein